MSTGSCRYVGGAFSPDLEPGRGQETPLPPERSLCPDPTSCSSSWTACAPMPLGCLGSPLGASPHVDAFAASGVTFSQAFCVHSVCMPTRASIATGRFPHIHGVWANGVPLRRSEVTLAQTLSEAGYATCASGKIHHEPQQPYRPLAPEITGHYYGFQEVHLSEKPSWRGVHALHRAALPGAARIAPSSVTACPRRRTISPGSPIRPSASSSARPGARSPSSASAPSMS